MRDITELIRKAAPVPKPQGLAFAGGKLWIGSRSTLEVVRLDIARWTTEWSVTAPGIPWGLGVVGAELRAVMGEGTDDQRFIRRMVPGTGFDRDFGIACPDDCGSHLSWTGSALTLSQWYPQKLLVLDAAGAVARTLSVPHQICGHTFARGAYWLVTTDHEETTDYWLTRVDPQSGQSEDLARIPFHARALAFDGEAFWTNHREANETVKFAVSP